MVLAAHIAYGCWWHDSGGCASLFGYCVLVFASSRATWKGSAVGSGLPEWWCWLVGLRQGKRLCVKLHGGMMDTGKATRLLYPPSSWTHHRSVLLFAFLSMLSTVCSLWLLTALPPSTSDEWGTLMQTFRFSARVMYVCFQLHIMLLLFNLCAFHSATPWSYR